MFRMKRTRCTALALLVALSLLLPLPAAAGGFWEKAPAQGWEGVWTGLLGWLGLLPAVEASSAMIDPFGQPAFSGYSSSIDPGRNP